ncbi:MAG: hypothetical protein U0354_19675, partial [Candidatus Sericytochromatia bacterium]
MSSINFNNLLSTVTTDSVIRKTVSLNPNNFSQSILQISDQQSRDKNYEKSLEYIRTYIASLQAKINSLVEELNTIYENMLTETLYRRADSKNTAKKINKLTNATTSTIDGTYSSLKDSNVADPDPDKTGIVPTGYDGETRQFQYNPFFGTRAADLSNYYNQTGNSTVSTARAYYQTTDNQHHEFGASALGALGYLWQWDLDRINASYATTMDKFIDSSGILHISANDPAAGGNPAGKYILGGSVYIDPVLSIVNGSANNPSEKLQVNITALQPNRGLADVSGVDAPKKIIPITNLDSWPGFQPGDIEYNNGTGYKFTPAKGNQLFFDTEKWAIVDVDGKEPMMEVLTRVTQETPQVTSIGSIGGGTYAYDSVYQNGSTAGWTNKSLLYNGNQATLRDFGNGEVWEQSGQTNNMSIVNIDLTATIQFQDPLIKYTPYNIEPPGQFTTSSGYVDDGWALYSKDATSGQPWDDSVRQFMRTGVGYAPYNGYRPPQNLGSWEQLHAQAQSGENTVTYDNSNPQIYQKMMLHLTGNSGGWAGGSPSPITGNSGGYASLKGDYSVTARTVKEDYALQRRYTVDEEGNIIDRFGINGYNLTNPTYGHFLGSFQRSNPSHSATNRMGNGIEDYNLYDYVPDPSTAPSLNKVSAIPDIATGDFYYYRENLNQGDTINLNGPNISFDPRATNMDGKLNVTTNRVEIKNTDFAMFGNTFLTYVEQNQDIYNQAKVTSFATWSGESDKDYVANNDTIANGEKDYKMALNFENKDENGVGILSAVRRVHVKIEGEPTIQDNQVDDWDSKTWQKLPILDQKINPWNYDFSTHAYVDDRPNSPPYINTDAQGGDSQIGLSTFADTANFSVTALNTLVSPGYWAPNGSKTVYTNEPWTSGGVKIPNLNVSPDTLTSISGDFTINNPGSYPIYGSSGDNIVKAQYFDGSSWLDIPGSQMQHIGCSGTHGAWGGTFGFSLPAPPAFDGMQIRVIGTFTPYDGSGTFTYPIDGVMDLEANKSTYVNPVYADKIVTKDIVSGSINLNGYRNARIVLNNNTQNSVAGAQVNRIIQYQDNSGSWIDLIANPPQGAISVDLPSSALSGNIKIRAVTTVKAFANSINTPAISDVWNISDLHVIAEPFPDEPKTLGLEMTKGFYNGVEQTGGGIINPISSTEPTYTPTYSAQQSGVQNFYTDING